VDGRDKPGHDEESDPRLAFTPHEAGALKGSLQISTPGAIYRRDLIYTNITRLSMRNRHSCAIMPNLKLWASAVVFLAAGCSMVFYEWSRVRAGRPLLQGRDLLKLYWIAYLSLIILGTTTALAAILR
jgi:hypothetical protein